MARVITELREERGLSAEQLAAATNFHPNSIARIESGATEPSVTMLVTLANALGVSTVTLIERAALDSIDEDW
jgi:transcriptional regulator with XRE-family HTH domain